MATRNARRFLGYLNRYLGDKVKEAHHKAEADASG